jgi:hypothetical protein
MSAARFKGVNAMNFNLFTWVREGVKQSILLGVSDAIETIGAPDPAADISPRLLDFLRKDSGTDASKRPGDGAARKRLGRTLRDLEVEPNA